MVSDQQYELSKKANEEIRESFNEKLLRNQNMGKILLITGPASSGKTTLASKMLQNIPNIFTINRKELFSTYIPQIISSAEEKFCSELLRDASEIIGRPITSSLELYNLKAHEMHSIKHEALIELKYKFKQIANTEEFDRFVLSKLFTEYYHVLKKHIVLGHNVILDEALINSQCAIDIFHSCCNNYSGIKTALLFNTLEDNIKNCIVRNKKFAALLTKFHNSSNLKLDIEKTIIESGGSTEMYRFPTSIIDNYKKYYEFKTSVGENDIILGQISKTELENLLYQIEKEQLKLTGLLSYKGYQKTLEKNLPSREKHLHKILHESELVYIVSRNKYDYYLNGSKITEVNLLNNPNFLNKFLGTILPWLTDSVPSYKKENSLPEINNNKITSPYIKQYNDVTSEVSIVHIFKNLSYQYKTILLKEYIDIEQLVTNFNIIIKNSFIGKTSIILVSLDDNNWAELIVLWTSRNTLQGVYYDPKSFKLEEQDLALIAIAALDLTINRLNDTSKFKLCFKVMQLRLEDKVVKSRDTNHQTKNLLELLLVPKILHNDNFLTTQLKEWNIWSKCFGKILVVNGVSSTGKTTIANSLNKFGFNRISIDDAYDEILLNYLKKHMPTTTVSLILSFLKFDDLKKILLQYKVNKEKYILSEQEYISEIENFINKHREFIFEAFSDITVLYNVTYEKTKQFIFSGKNVVIDVMLPSNTQVDLFTSHFNNYPISFCLLYSTLEENLNKCYFRNNLSLKNDLCDYRYPYQVISQYFQFYVFIPSSEKSSYITLDKIVTDKAVELIKFAIEMNNQLLYEVVSYSYFTKQHFNQKMLLEEQIDKISKLAILNFKELLIVPAVKYDYVIKSINLQVIDNTNTDLIFFSLDENNILEQNIIELLGEFLGYNVEM